MITNTVFKISYFHNAQDNRGGPRQHCQTVEHCIGHRDGIHWLISMVPFPTCLASKSRLVLSRDVDNSGQPVKCAGQATRGAPQNLGSLRQAPHAPPDEVAFASRVALPASVVGALPAEIVAVNRPLSYRRLGQWPNQPERQDCNSSGNDRTHFCLRSEPHHQPILILATPRVEMDLGPIWLSQAESQAIVV